MPSERAIRVAESGPVACLVAFVVLVVPLVVLREYLLSARQTLLLALPTFAAFLVLVVYQGLFMVAFPDVAVERRIRPPMSTRSPWLRDLCTPNSRLGARVIGGVSALGSAAVGGVLLASWGSALL